MFNSFECIITPTIALLVFVVVLIIALLIAGFTNPSRYNNTRASIFISCIAGLSIIVTFLFYFAVVQLQQQQVRQSIVDTTTSLRKSLLRGVLDPLHEANASIPYFVSTLFPLLNVSCSSVDELSDAQKLLKHRIAYKIFSLWQEFIVAVPFLDIDVKSFICHFLQRAHSPLLLQEWNTTKLDFNAGTQILGDLLFTYACRIHNPSISEFEKCAEKLEKEPEFLRILYE